jgi:hypothetical protein
MEKLWIVLGCEFNDFFFGYRIGTKLLLLANFEILKWDVAKRGGGFSHFLPLIVGHFFASLQASREEHGWYNAADEMLPVQANFQEIVPEPAVRLPLRLVISELPVDATLL